MLNLDSVRIEVGSEVIKDVNLYKMRGVEEKDGNELISKYYYLYGKGNNEKQIGIKNIIYNVVTDKIKIDISSKILRENYYKLINLNTIDECVAKLNENGAILFNNKFISNATVYNLDITNDVHCDKELNNYINMLSEYNINHKYKLDTWDNNSIKFKRNVKSYREYLRVYNKYKDMQKKDNIKLLQYTNIDKYKNILRVESMHSTHRRIKDILNVSKNEYGKFELLDVLKCNEKVNYKMLNRIVEPVDQLTLFDEYDSNKTKWNDIVKDKGNETIIKECGYDIDKIIKYLKVYVKGNVSRYIKEYKIKILEMKEKSKRKKDMERELLIEIKEKLLKAS